MGSPPPAAVRDVQVVIFHPLAPTDAGPLTALVAAARADLADQHRRGFEAAGATTVRVVAGAPDNEPFGARLRRIARDLVGDDPGTGLIVLGSGAVPLITTRDRRRFVDAASADRPIALVNNRFSADIAAVADAGRVLVALPDLAVDNALPRWLAEVAGVEVSDLRRRWRLGVDIDGPLDLVLLGGRWSAMVEPLDRARAAERLAAIRVVVADPRAEVIIAGRTSFEALAWLGRAGAARTRAIVEERGLRTAVAGQRPAGSVLGALLDRDGPGALGELLARIGEAAVIDTRVLLAHRLGADEGGWPSPEDRYASDLLLHERIVDPWLRELTRSAALAAIPIALGGHTLVGPGLRLAVGP